MVNTYRLSTKHDFWIAKSRAVTPISRLRLEDRRNLSAIIRELTTLSPAEGSSLMRPLSRHSSNLIAQHRSQGCVSSGRFLQICPLPSSWFPICSTAAGSAEPLCSVHPGVSGLHLCQRSIPHLSPEDQDRFAHRGPPGQSCRRLPRDVQPTAARSMPRCLSLRR